MTAALRRLARVTGAVLVLSAVVVAAWPGWAGAARPEAQGWWYRPQQSGTPVAVPAPPVVPANGLYVAQGPNDEDLAVSALSYAVQGFGPARLTLTLASGVLGTVAVTACPASSGFTPVAAGPWDEVPAYNCTIASSDGVVAEDGTTVAFDLPAEFVAASAASMDIVLIPTPGADPFQAPIEEPGDDSFVQSALPGVPPPSEPAPAVSSGSGDSDFAGDSSSGSFDLGGTGDAFAGGSTAAPPAPVPTVGDVSRRRAAPRPTAPVAATPDTTSERVMAIVLLGIMGVGLWWLGGRPLPARAAAGRPRTATEAPVGGIGRFARVRSSAPNRL